jgi:predicted dehydrogenase
MERLRAGVIGCGAIAQMMHLPYLRELDDRFELSALCDVDGGTLEQVADHYGVAARHQDVAGLLAEPLDVVFILSSGDHTEPVISALESGRHVFVEKPLAYTLQETDQILECARRADRVLMVGMMKQFDPGYRRGTAAVHELQDLRFVDARTLQPDNELYMSHHPILRGSGGRRETVAGASGAFGPAFFKPLQDRLLSEPDVIKFQVATGSDRPEVLTAFQFLVGSSIHDVNVLRGVLGQPSGVACAHTWAGGTSFTATLVYADDIRVNYTWTLIPYLKHYEEEFSFYASDGRVHIRFPSPYLRNEPTIVDIERMEGDELQMTRVITSYEEAFKRELLEFDDGVRTGRQPLTDGEGFRLDLEVLIEIARAF